MPGVDARRVNASSRARTSGGGEFLNNFSAGLAGVDFRAGVQINNLFGVYIQPSLAFGAGTFSNGGPSGATGTAGVAALVDFTFVDRVFVAAGGGVGVLNNPVGPEIQFRVGAYPLMGRGMNGITRKGLMVGVDTRLYFLSSAGSNLTVMQLMACVGYEVF